MPFRDSEYFCIRELSYIMSDILAIFDPPLNIVRPFLNFNVYFFKTIFWPTYPKIGRQWCLFINCGYFFLFLLFYRYESILNTIWTREIVNNDECFDIWNSSFKSYFKFWRFQHNLKFLQRWNAWQTVLI